MKINLGKLLRKEEISKKYNLNINALIIETTFVDVVITYKEEYKTLKKIIITYNIYEDSLKELETDILYMDKEGVVNLDEIIKD